MGMWAPVVGQTITVLYCTPDEYLFRGVIRRVTTHVQQGQSPIFDVEAVDYTWTLNLQLALGGRYKNISMNAVVTDLLTPVTFGVDRGHVPTTLGAVPELRIEALSSIGGQLTRLARLAGGYWRLTPRDLLIDLFSPGTDEDGNRPILTNSSTIRGLRSVTDGTQMANYVAVVGSGGDVTTPAPATQSSLTVSEIGWYSAPYPSGGKYGLLEGTVLQFNCPSGSGVGTISSITSAETGFPALPYDVPEGALLRSVAFYQSTSASAAYGVLARTIQAWNVSADAINSIAVTEVGMYAAPLRSLRYVSEDRWLRVGQYISASITTPSSVVGTYVIQRLTTTPRIITSSVVSLEKTVEAGVYFKPLSEITGSRALAGSKSDRPR